MITIVKDKEGHETVAISFSPIVGRRDLKGLRDALADILETCVMTEQAKDVSDAYSLYLLSSLVRELTNDIECNETD